MLASLSCYHFGQITLPMMDPTLGPKTLQVIQNLSLQRFFTGGVPPSVQVPAVSKPGNDFGCSDIVSGDLTVARCIAQKWN
jgi:hypothetical protein